MSDKTEMLIVEVEKRPISYADKGRRDCKDAKKQENAWKHIAQGVRLTAVRIAIVTAQNTAFCIQWWFVGTFEHKVARNGQVRGRGRGRALYKQAFSPVFQMFLCTSKRFILCA